MAVELSSVVTPNPEGNTSVVLHEESPEPTETIIFADPREQRVIRHYAEELIRAEQNNNWDYLEPRYEASDWESQNPSADSLKTDPLKDPRITAYSAMLKASGYKPEYDPDPKI